MKEKIKNVAMQVFKLKSDFFIRIPNVSAT